MTIVSTKRPDSRKLHRRLAEGGKLRIYRVIRGETRCVICATAIVSVRNRNHHLKENPTLKQRMEDPEKTNGKPMVVQFWLQDDQGQLIGPCGAACGPKAVMNAWLKERRNEIRQQLLAAGVPSAEVEDRLEQIAHQEWLNMLRVYRQAEREAKKYKIDTTSMTVDEIIAAVRKVKEEKAFKIEVGYAQYAGVPVKLLSNGAEIDGVICRTTNEVRDAVSSWKERKYQAKQAQAKQARLANRAKYPEYVEFIEWALASTEPGQPNACKAATWDRNNLEQGLMYIDLGNPYPKTLQQIEEIAGRARQWLRGWNGKLGPLVPIQQQNAPAPSQAPQCPLCGRSLVRRTGVSKNGKRYDFYGCTGFPKCKGSMEVVEYNRRLSAAGGVPQLQPQAQPQPQVTITASKAVAHLQAQAASLGVKTSQPPAPSPPILHEEMPEAPVKKKRRQGYWS